MCNFNPFCYEVDGKCKCFQNSAMKGNPIYHYLGQPSMMLYAINLVANSNSLLESALAKAYELQQKVLSRQSQPIPDSNLSTTIFSFSTTSKEALLLHLCGDNHNFSYFISLCDDIPKPAYKDRCFTVYARILDSNNNYATLPTPTTFKLQMYSQENPPKLIETNTSGNLCIRGNIKVESTSIIIFKKVAVNEVTSHFRNGSVFFVVLSERIESIKPCIIEDFVVRARKPDVSKPEKKNRFTEDEE
ncbi:hypothetical protein SteCoe_923 [Stentor coeruleus]|uniref:Uncharacterized protein n=1 Tax=Stentor coeruleus TaxID=5963 RepID=A0A1R2D348_9CILI|nr:hypothetical protein SteCoe_923 [Stentor coeruleus]